MIISVVAAAREDDQPATEIMLVASLADRLGYGEVWVGEGPTWDAFVAATAIGLNTQQIAITVGPVPVSVRDPATIGRGAASVATVTGRSIGVALGASSTRVVEGFHGRSRARVLATLSDSAASVRALFDEQPSEQDTAAPGFRWRLSKPGGPLTVAAFGDGAIAVAANHADRMVLDLVAPEQVTELRAKLHTAAARAGRAPPVLAAWLPAAIDPQPEGHQQIQRSIVRYLTVRGYSDMFAAAGFGDAVEMAAAGADPEELLDALPAEAASSVGLVGDTDSVRARLETYAAAGLDEVAVVPATAGDPGGERTLTALAPAR